MASAEGCDYQGGNSMDLKDARVAETSPKIQKEPE